MISPRSCSSPGGHARTTAGPEPAPHPRARPRRRPRISADAKCSCATATRRAPSGPPGSSGTATARPGAPSRRRARRADDRGPRSRRPRRSGRARRSPRQGVGDRPELGVGIAAPPSVARAASDADRPSAINRFTVRTRDSSSSEYSGSPRTIGTARAARSAAPRRRAPARCPSAEPAHRSAGTPLRPPPPNRTTSRHNFVRTFDR